MFLVVGLSTNSSGTYIALMQSLVTINLHVYFKVTKVFKYLEKHFAFKTNTPIMC